MSVVWVTVPQEPGKHTFPVNGTAMVSATEIPGLMDVQASDGRLLRDVTMGQLKSLAWREGWLIEFTQA